jgi:Protein of unknown function (DUF2877)
LTQHVPARLVATPALERLSGGAGGTVLGAGATAAWVDLGGFVLAVTTREVPLLPNAVALAAGGGVLARVGPGDATRCAPGRIELAGLTVTWDPVDPPAWDPSVPAAGPGAAAVGRRGEAILAAAGVEPGADPRSLVRELAAVGLATATEPGGAVGLGLLLRAVLDRDAGLAAEAAGRLLGRGPGLTPEGDDLLAAVAGTLAVLGPAAGVGGEPLAALLGALAAVTDEDGGPAGPVPPVGRRRGAPDRTTAHPATAHPATADQATAHRTTALSVTLLQLAARGLLAEPAGRLLDLGPEGERAWPGALRRLERLGHGSGRAYAAGIGAAARLLAAGGGVG